MSEPFDTLFEEYQAGTLTDANFAMIEASASLNKTETASQKLKEAVFQAMGVPAEALGEPELTEEQKAVELQQVKASVNEAMAKKAVWDDEAQEWTAQPVTTDGTNFSYTYYPSKEGMVDQTLKAWKADPDLWELVQQKLKKDGYLKKSDRRYWLLRATPETLLAPFMLEGIFFLKTVLPSYKPGGEQAIDPDTKVFRTWYDPERNQICMILEGKNGFQVPEGGTPVQHEPLVTLLELDYERPEQLQELLTKDPAVGPGLAEWLRGCFRDMLELGIPTKE